MRLKNVDRGDGLRSRAILGAIGLVSGTRAPDVLRTLMYRSSFFGRPHSDHTHAVLRGPSEHWAVWERELIAAIVSKRNSCEF